MKKSQILDSIVTPKILLLSYRSKYMFVQYVV